MCSDRSPRRSPLAALFAAGLVLSLAAACGKQGDPRPRPRNIPQPASDLSLRLRGETLLFAFAYPASTVAGLPLDGVESATVYEIVQPLAATAALPKLGPADFDAVAKPVRVLSGRELADAVAGDRILTEIVLPAGAVGAEQARIYAVRTQALRGEPSPWSNAIALRPLAAPEAPGDLEVTAKKSGIELRWTPNPDGLGTVVLRREASVPRWSAPLVTLPADATSFVDRGALYGSRYVYTVLTLAVENPPVESAPRAEREVDYRDLFAPEPPRELRALVAGGEVRLVWDASPDVDLAGYHVERSADGGEFSRLNAEPVAALEFTDRTPPAGAAALAYRLVAVDRAGNAAPPTAAVEVRGR
jgi:hypothetical protein